MKFINFCPLISKSTNMFVKNCFGLILIVNSAWFVHIFLLIQTRWLLFWQESSFFSQKQWLKFNRKQAKNILMNLFLTNMQLFTSHDVNWWTGVVWITLRIIVMFLSAVWTLILTAPIHCIGTNWGASDVMQIFFKSPNKHSSTGLPAGE